MLLSASYTKRFISETKKAYHILRNINFFFIPYYIGICLNFCTPVFSYVNSSHIFHNTKMTVYKL